MSVMPTAATSSTTHSSSSISHTPGTSNIPKTMFANTSYENLVIQVQPCGRRHSHVRRKVTVAASPLLGDAKNSSNGSASHPSDHQHHQQHTEASNSSVSSYNNINGNNPNGKEMSPKKEKNAMRHSHHQQQSTNSSAAPGKESTNSVTVAGKSLSGHNNSHKDSSGRRSGVTRERSFLRSHPPTQTLHQDVLAVGGRPNTVQRQRSCVASLYAQHGRSHSSAAMPAATATAYQRPKPAMQLYRPPTLRVSDDYAMPNGSYVYEDCNGTSESFSGGSSFKPGLNINAKEFVSSSTNGDSHGTSSSSNGVHNMISFNGPNGVSGAALMHSRSSSQVPVSRHNGGSVNLQVYKSAKISTAAKDGRNESAGAPPLRVHFTDDTIAYDPGNKVGMIQRFPTTTNYLMATTPQIIPIKRSKSLGSAADLNNHHHHHANNISKNRQFANGSNGTNGSLFSGSESTTTVNANNAISDMEPFPDEVTQKLQQVLQCPPTAPARVVMEAVRQVFHKLMQGKRYAEPASRYCIAVIEKESECGEDTFLDTLLNTCQEYYQERDRLLRLPPPSTPTCATPATHARWVAYMTFLHEMYTQVKRRHRTVVSSAAPALLLLTLLSECCVVSLREQAQGGVSMAQTECLFFILTCVGKDIELELPAMMARVMGSARDALFAAARAPAVRKTLLQLIEMNAASWQLPAPAVMYYYPGVAGK